MGQLELGWLTWWEGGESCGGLEECFGVTTSPDQTASTPTQGFGCEPLLFLSYNGVLYLWLYSPEEHHVHYLWKVIVRLIGRAGHAGCAGLRRG